MKKLKITKEAKALAKRPYTRVVYYDFEEKCYWGIVPELPHGLQKTDHHNKDKIQKQIDDLIVTVIAWLLEKGQSIPAPQALNTGQRLFIDMEEHVAYYEDEAQTPFPASLRRAAATVHGLGKRAVGASFERGYLGDELLLRN